MRDHWDVSGRDVVPNLAAGGRPLDVGAAILHALLSSRGAAWAPPYDIVRTNLQIRKKAVLPELEDRKNSRIRTYTTLFAGLGLIYVDGGTLEVTEVGQQLLEILNDQYQAVDDFGRSLSLNNLDRLARLVVMPLAKYQLSSPLSSNEYPPGTDIRPLMAMWRVMRSLDNKLHWEELGRALTPCLREEDIPRVIDQIGTARANAAYDPTDQDRMANLLGPRKPDQGADQSDRLDTWFSRAAFKSLLLEQRDRPDGYRHLSPRFVPLLDEVLAEPPLFNPTADVTEYVRWLGEKARWDIGSDPTANLDSVVERVVARSRRFGARQIVTLVGPAGTGKTTVAQRAAEVLADGDPTRVLTVQFHAGFTYEEFVAGLVPTDPGKFEPKEGALLQINDMASKDPEGRTHVLVIDELSRADVGNVLGELLTYIEYRGRPFRLPVLDRDVSIAPNLVVIATMNPADRSVVNMDDALVRRLRQVQISGSPEALDEILVNQGVDPALRKSVVGWFKNLPEDAPFGHGVFVGVRDEADLRSLWEEELQYFLRRGGLTLYPDPERIETGFVWRHWEQTLESDQETEVAPAAEPEEDDLDNPDEEEQPDQ